VSIRIHNDSDAAVAAAGIATDWPTFSVLLRPLPCSHALYDPPCAGRDVLFVITPVVPVQFAVPDSKPEFCRRLSPDGGGPPV